MSYDPTIGRWTEADPEGYVDGDNLYQFVDSNPVGATDPYGLSPAAGPATLPAMQSPPAGTTIHDPSEPVSLGGPGFYDTFLAGANWGNTYRSTTDGRVHTRFTPLELPDPLPSCMGADAAALKRDVKAFNQLAQAHEEQNQRYLEQHSVALVAPGTGQADREEAQLLYDMFSRLQDIMAKCNCSDVNSKRNLNALKARLEYWQQRATKHPLPPLFPPSTQP